MIRRTQVYVGDYIPPHPSHIELLMLKFVEWLNLPENRDNLHPIRFAALAHYKLVYIHPFVDGNGRTSRDVFFKTFFVCFTPRFSQMKGYCGAIYLKVIPLFG